MKIIFSKNYKDKIPGGLADNKIPQDFDKNSLQKGINIQKQHTSDDNIAKQIAMDHLTEDKNYYQKLQKIQKKANSQNKFIFNDKDSQFISYSIEETEKYLILSKILVNKNYRNQGIAKRFIKQLKQYAKLKNKPIYLTPTNEFGSSKQRLTNWYKSEGFKNKKNNDNGPWEKLKLNPNQ